MMTMMMTMTMIMIMMIMIIIIGPLEIAGGEPGEGEFSSKIPANGYAYKNSCNERKQKSYRQVCLKRNRAGEIFYLLSLRLFLVVHPSLDSHTNTPWLPKA